MDATANRSANQAVELEFDVEARQEITLKVMPIKDGIAQPVLLGSPRIGMFRYIGERQDGLLANRLEHASTRDAQAAGKDRSHNDVAEDVSEVRTWMHIAYGIARPLEIPTRHIGLNRESKYEVKREGS